MKTTEGEKYEYMKTTEGENYEFILNKINLIEQKVNDIKEKLDTVILTYKLDINKKQVMIQDWLFNKLIKKSIEEGINYAYAKIHKDINTVAEIEIDLRLIMHKVLDKFQPDIHLNHMLETYTKNAFIYGYNKVHDSCNENLPEQIILENATRNIDLIKTIGEYIKFNKFNESDLKIQI